jgi:hypothetical protein
MPLYDGRVRMRHFLLTVLYVGYLVQVGLLLLLLPWSQAWSSILLELPYRLGIVLDAPAIRGLISGFGLLHLLLLLVELGRGGPFASRDSRAR